MPGISFDSRFGILTTSYGSYGKAQTLRARMPGSEFGGREEGWQHKKHRRHVLKGVEQVQSMVRDGVRGSVGDRGSATSYLTAMCPASIEALKLGEMH